MTHLTAIGVIAEPPLPSRCKRDLLAAHPAPWVARLYAAMLRDSLDGLLSISASDYLVAHDAEEEVRRTLATHVHAPWTLPSVSTDPSALIRRLAPDASARAILARSDAPSADIETVLGALREDPTPRVIVGPSEQGLAWLIATVHLKEEERDALFLRLPWNSPELVALLRVRAAQASLPLTMLEPAIIVDQPSDVLALIDELRRHPERAPRTAQFITTDRAI